MIVGLALRQAWITYRLLALILAPVLVTALAVGADSGGLLARGQAWQVLAVGLSATTLLTAAVEAAGLAADRQRGMLGWLAVRAVPRPKILSAWFGAPLVAALVGTATALAVARMTLQPALVGSLDDVAYLATLAAILAATLLAAAIGLIAGVLTRPARAGLLTALLLVLVGSAAVGATVVVGAQAGGPVAGFWLLAQSMVIEDPLSSALLSTGLSLALAAGLWVVAAAAFSRRSL